MRLWNGLRVRIEERRAGGLVAVALTYGAGMMDHPAGRRGLPHLVEHLAMQGSEHVERGSKLLSDVGGDVNAFTKLDTTTYLAVVPRGYLERALWVESDRMGFLNASLTEARLKAERNIVNQEWISRNGDVRGGMTTDLVIDELFPEGDRRRAATDVPEEVAAITLDDVRGYLDAHYHPNNATLSVVGDIDTDAAAAIVRRYFDDLPRSPEPIVTPPRGAVTFDGQMTLTLVSESERSMLNVFYAIPTPKDSTDVVVSRVMAARLERALQAELVTKHSWARGVEVSAASIGGAWFVWIGVVLRRNVRHAVIESSIDSAIEFLKNGSYDIADAKRSVVMDRTRNFASLRKRAIDLAEGDMVVPLDAEVRAVEQVTQAQVRRYANERLNAARRLVVRERAATETSRVGAVYGKEGRLYGGSAP